MLAEQNILDLIEAGPRQTSFALAAGGSRPDHGMPNRHQNFVSSRHYVELSEQFIGIGFWNADLNSGEIHGTGGFFRIIGLPCHEKLDLQRWIHLLHPEDREDFRAVFSIANMVEFVSREVRLMRHGRTPRWIRVTTEQSPSTGRLVGLVQDLSAEREMRAAVYRERKRLTTYLDLTHEIFWAMDVAGTVIDLQGWEAVTGQSQDECRKGGWVAMIHPEDRERILAKWSDCLRNDIPFEGDYRLHYADGLYRRVKARCMPVRQENGRSIEWLGSLQEVWRFASERLAGEPAALKPQILRAARALLGWSADKLAREAGVSSATIRRYETSDEHMKEATVASILSALNSYGVTVTSSSESMSLSFTMSDEDRSGKR